MGSEMCIRDRSVPEPASLVVTSNTDSPITAGSSPTLTCTVELNPAVDVPVTVNTVWTGPDGFTTSNSEEVMGGTTTYTRAVVVSSLGREQSGNYTCIATVSSTSPFLTDSGSQSGTARVTVGKFEHLNPETTMVLFISGVYLSLRDVIVPADSTVSLNDIGSAIDALVCHTDRPNCCRGTRQGGWFYPISVNGSEVPTGNGAVFSRNRTDEGMINLNRIVDAMPPSGLYCCKVLDARSIDQTVCVNIGELSHLCCTVVKA